MLQCKNCGKEVSIVKAKTKDITIIYTFDSGLGFTLECTCGAYNQINVGYARIEAAGIIENGTYRDIPC